MKNIFFKSLIILSIVSSICSCNDDGCDKNKCLESVKKEFPNCKIYTEIGGSNFLFFVIDTNSYVLYRVKTGNYRNATITEVELLKKQ